MGLLSDYADINGGMGGLLGVPQDASAYTPQTSGLLAPGGMSDETLQALLASMSGQPQSDPSASLIPQTSALMNGGGGGAPDWYNAAPTMGADASAGAPQLPPSPNSMPSPPAQGSPSSAPPMVGQSSQPPQLQGAPGAPQAPPAVHHGNLLGGLLGGVAGIATLPFKVLNAYGAAADAVPRNIAFQQTEHALALRSAVQGQALINSLLGDGGGSLFGSQPTGSLVPPQAPLTGGAGPGLLPSASPPLGASPPPGSQSGGARGFATPLNQDTRPEDATGPNPNAPPSTPSSASPPMMGGSPASNPPQLPASSGGFDLRNPRTQKVIAALDLLGNPAGEKLTTLGTAVMPKYEAVRPGGFMTVNGQFTGASAPDNGTYNVPDGKGGFTNIPVTGALANSAAMTAGTDAAKATVAQLYGPKTAGDTAAAVEAAKAPYTMVTVPMADGSKRDMPLSVYQSAIRGKGGVAAASAGFGVTPSPAAAAYATDQAGGLNEAITADQNARQAAMQQHDAAARAVSIASTLPFNPAAPTMYQARKLASVLGVPSKEMDSAAVYNQLSTQAILAYAKGNLPSRFTERELALTKPVIGSIKDPNSAALMAAGLQAAIANKAIARAQYADAYNPSRSGLTRQQYEAGWAATPAGRSSLFADPVWAGVKIGGQPAVSRFTGPNGKPYLAVTPGLGKATYLPVN